MPVSELYTDANNPNSVIAPPPAPPSPVPPPTQVVVTQPISTKRRMADEKPDGTLRDTSTEALRPGNDLSFREFDPDPKESAATPTAEAPPEQVAPPPAPAPEPPPKLYAGKYKTAEELENAYKEAQVKLTQQSQRAADAERAATAKAAEPPAPRLSEEERKSQLLADLVADPDKTLGDIAKRQIQQTQVALDAQQMTENWRKANADIAEHEFFVTAEVQRLMQADPELARNPAALLNEATTRFRQVVGKLRTEGAREALTTESRVIPLLSNTAPAPATEHPPQEAPLTADAAFDKHIAMLKASERRSHQGLRR